jgi:hypothetical protein
LLVAPQLSKAITSADSANIVPASQHQTPTEETANNAEIGSSKTKPDDRLYQDGSVEKPVDISHEAVVSHYPYSNSSGESGTVSDEQAVSRLSDVHSDGDRQTEHVTDERGVTCSSRHEQENQGASCSLDNSSSVEYKSPEQEPHTESIAEDAILSGNGTVQLSMNSAKSDSDSTDDVLEETDRSEHVEDRDVSEDNEACSVSDDKVVASDDKNEDCSEKSAGSEVATESCSRDDKTDEDSLLFTDARSEVSDLDSSDPFAERTLREEAADCDKHLFSDAGDERIAAVSNQEESTVVSIADNVVVESSNTDFSTNPRGATKPKTMQVYSLFFCCCNHLSF